MSLRWSEAHAAVGRQQEIRVWQCEVKPGFRCAGQSGSERLEPPEWGAIEIAELLDGYHRDNRNLT